MDPLSILIKIGNHPRFFADQAKGNNSLARRILADLIELADLKRAGPNESNPPAFASVLLHPSQDSFRTAALTDRQLMLLKEAAQVWISGDLTLQELESTIPKPHVPYVILAIEPSPQTLLAKPFHNSLLLYHRFAIRYFNEHSAQSLEADPQVAQHAAFLDEVWSDLRRGTQDPARSSLTAQIAYELAQCYAVRHQFDLATKYLQDALALWGQGIDPRICTVKRDQLVTLLQACASARGHPASDLQTQTRFRLCKILGGAEDNLEEITAGETLIRLTCPREILQAAGEHLLERSSETQLEKFGLPALRIFTHLALTLKTDSEDEMLIIFRPAIPILRQSSFGLGAMAQFIRMVDLYLMPSKTGNQSISDQRDTRVQGFVLDVCSELNAGHFWDIAEQSQVLRRISPDAWTARRRKAEVAGNQLHQPLPTAVEGRMQLLRRWKPEVQQTGASQPSDPQTARSVAIKLQQHVIKLLEQEDYPAAHEANEAAARHLLKCVPVPADMIHFRDATTIHIQIGSAMKNAGELISQQVLPAVLTVMTSMAEPFPPVILSRYLTLSCNNSGTLGWGEQLASKLENKIMGDRTLKNRASRALYHPNDLPDFFLDNHVQLRDTAVHLATSVLASSSGEIEVVWKLAVDILFKFVNQAGLRMLCGLLAGVVTLLQPELEQLLPTCQGALLMFVNPAYAVKFWPSSPQCQLVYQRSLQMPDLATRLNPAMLPLLLVVLKKMYEKALEDHVDFQLLLALADVEQALGQRRAAYKRYFHALSMMTTHFSDWSEWHKITASSAMQRVCLLASMNEDYITVAFLSQILDYSGTRKTAFDALTKAWEGTRPTTHTVADAFFVDENMKPASCFWDFPILAFSADMFRKEGSTDLVELLIRIMGREEFASIPPEQGPNPYQWKMQSTYFRAVHARLFMNSA
ncbi:hypothetical protein HK097_010896 [Rhizophlyctis rosea]|uniref:Uncharacterized protein n=1 Tax=Rhizophlyctis rosea TaxID=64517 RepID=A0AAD5SH22_9FUNG|nr:hypothetical protein HK097_010896 [Rhizophlyctis rosea]